MKNRKFAVALTGLACALSTTAVVAASTTPAYPAKSVRVLVGLAPGGATDIQARWYAQKLGEQLHTSFIVDNRSGAGGLIAYKQAASAAPDGYTLIAATATFTILPMLQPQMPYDPINDFAPIALMTKAPYIVVVLASSPTKSMKEMIAFAKAKPGELMIGLPGTGTTDHLGALWLAQVTNTKITTVPYKGAGLSLAAVSSGEVTTTFANVLSALPIVRSGRLRALAITTGVRSEALPDLPTIAESGVPGYDLYTWHGWLAPKGTAPALVARLNHELAKVITTPEIAEKLVADGAIPVVNTPAQFKEHITAEVNRWKKLVQETGLNKS